MRLIPKLFIAFSSLCVVNNSLAHGHDTQQSTGNKSKQSLSFIANKGQWIQEAKFKAEIPGGAMFLTDKGFVYNFVSQKDMARIHDLTCGSNAKENVDVTKEIVHHHAYKVNFLGANTDIQYSSSEKKDEYHNYFIDNDKSKWAGKVGLYGVVEQKNVYNGIDVKVYSSNSTSLKYDFVVAPGANPNQIALSFEGVLPTITKDGSLKIKTSVNEILEKAPVTYQIIDGKEVKVASKYKLDKGVLTFEFPNGYNSQYALVIDPDLIFATFSGGVSSAFYAHSTAYDKAGNTYTAALAYGTGWPATVGAYQIAYPGTYTSAVNKYSVDGTTLVFSTYFGGTGTAGSNNIQPNTIRVNDNDEFVLAGNVTNPNMPVTTGAYQTTMSGTSDIYVARFSDDGSALLASTYIGGSGLESLMIGATTNYTALGAATNAINPADITFDNNGDIWVTSNSASTNFPVTANAYQATNAGGNDVVLFKMSADLTTLVYSTYFGGNGWDGGIGLEYNEKDNTVGVVGYTASTTFPTTTGAFKTTKPGGIDGFAILLSNINYQLVASTYLGTIGDDIAMRLAFDCAGNYYVAGRTNGNYPLTSTQGHVPNGFVFLDKLNPGLSTSLASTRTGAAITSIVPSSMMVDICGNILVATITSSSLQQNMPLTADAFETSPRAFYFAAFQPNFTDLLFGSYYGSVSGTSTTDHYHPGISRMDPEGIIYHSVCASGTSGSAWPVSTNAYAPTKLNGTTNDNITFKFNFEATNINIQEQSTEGGMDTIPHSVRGCKSAFIDFSRLGDLDSAMTIHYIISGDAVNGVDYQWIADSIVIPANQDSATLEIKPLLIAGSSPNGYVDLIIDALSPCGCEDGTDNIVKTARVRIYDSLYVRLLTPYDTVCPNTPFTIEAEIDSTLNYTWTPAIFNQGSLTINPTAYATSQYTITVTQPGAPLTCPPVSRTYEIFVEPVPQIMIQPKEITICGTDSLDINVVVGPAGTNYIYSWSPPEYLRDDFSSNNKFLAPVGDYKKVITVTTPVANCTSSDSILIHVVPGFEFQSISNDTTIKYGDTIRLNTESDAVSWIWSPITHLSDPLAKDPVARPLETTNYEVIGIDQYGCRDTANVLVKVEHVTVANIPNAFSPNGDGTNDVFKIEHIKFERMTEFKVFNKYGQVVFETQNPAKGWDGTINGAPADVDVYHYIIRLTMPDASQKVFKGDVTLIR